jgi:hypothetical protein
MDYKFLASREAFEFAGQAYADYMEASIQEHVDKGVYSLEYALQATLSDRLAGNEGE